MQDEHAYFNRLLELQALVASASTRFINVTIDDTHAEIVSCLGSIAVFLGADAASINFFGCAEAIFKNRYHWVASHMRIPTPEEVDDNELNRFQWTMNMFRRGQCVLVPSKESIPVEAVEERQVYEALGLKSAFHIPVFKDRNLIGAISFLAMTAPLFLDEKMVCLLRMLGEIFANLYARKEAEKAVADSELHYREMAELVPVAIYEMTLDGRLTYINRKGFELFGYTPSDQDRGLSALDMVTPGDRERGAFILSSPVSNDGSAHAYEALRKDGTTFPVIIYSIPIIMEGRITGIRGAVVDLTEQKMAEEKLMASLQEKEILIKEIHHRVKNNMQLVTSLFHLQISHTDNPVVKNILQMTGNRMKSIALVHEQCYRSSDFRYVDILPFIRALGVQLKCTFPLENVEFTVKGARLFLDMQKAIPFGIIANEILSNAFRHAFGEEEAGHVSLEVETQGEGEWKITFGDSGKGIPPHVDLESPETLGLRLIRDLADQIDGKLTIERGRGTVYTLRIPC